MGKRDAEKEILPDNRGVMMRNKKGLSPLGIIGSLLVVAVVVILFLFILNKWLSSQSDIVGGQIGGVQGDADKDSIRNFFDKCPCTFGDSISDGCPAIFTEEQKKEDVKKYNSEPPCGIVAGEAPVRIGTTTVEHVGREEPEQAIQFKKYQSIEIFGDAIDEEDLPKDGTIRLACTGFVGGEVVPDCHSEDNDCDGEFNLQPLKDGCWVMASEDDNEGNDCGQARVDDGTIIPLREFKNLKVDVINNYLSLPNEGDPKNIFSWRWKSKDEYGSLLCNKGAWYGCKEVNEGKTKQVNSLTYKCTGSEWVKQ
ncbi:MAG: hypothetical protein Q8R47_01175 [Nanoarchaeota archaeon]|nr:hypothetical protein [Nanoarchaeota archaeon]